MSAEFLMERNWSKRIKCPVMLEARSCIASMASEKSIFTNESKVEGRGGSLRIGASQDRRH